MVRCGQGEMLPGIFLARGCHLQVMIIMMMMTMMMMMKQMAMVLVMSFSIPIRTFGVPPSASPIFSISQKTSNAISWRRIHPRKSQSLALNGPNLSDFRVQGCPGAVSEKKSMAAVEMINQDLHTFTVINPLDGVIWGKLLYPHSG